VSLKTKPFPRWVLVLVVLPSILLGVIAELYPSEITGDAITILVLLVFVGIGYDIYKYVKRCIHHDPRVNGAKENPSS